MKKIIFKLCIAVAALTAASCWQGTIMAGDSSRGTREEKDYNASGSLQQIAQEHLNRAADILTEKCDIPPRYVYSVLTLIGVATTVYIAKQTAIPFICGVALGTPIHYAAPNVFEKLKEPFAATPTTTTASDAPQQLFWHDFSEGGVTGILGAVAFTLASHTGSAPARLFAAAGVATGYALGRFWDNKTFIDPEVLHNAAQKLAAGDTNGNVSLSSAKEISNNIFIAIKQKFDADKKGNIQKILGAIAGAAIPCYMARIVLRRTK